MTNRCSPHDWAIPNVGDTELVCVNAACGRRLSFGSITINMRVSIVAAQYRLGGDEYEEAFEGAYTGAHDALYPPLEVDAIRTPYTLPPSRRYNGPHRSEVDAIKPPVPYTLRPSHRYNGAGTN